MFIVLTMKSHNDGLFWNIEFMNVAMSKCILLQQMWNVSYIVIKILFQLTATIVTLFKILLYPLFPGWFVIVMMEFA